MVTHVDDEGFVFFLTVGGQRPDVLHGQRVEVATKGGPVPGVIGRKGGKRSKAGEKPEQLELEDLHIDIGARDRDEALGRLQIGDVAVLATEPVELAGGRLASRSLDNRLGAYVALEAARRVAEAGGAPGDVAAVAAVQEEVGDFGGARTTRLRARAAGRARGRRDRRDRHPRRRPEDRRRGQARRRPDRQPRLDDQPEGLRAARRDGRGGGDRATPSTSRPATRTPTWTPRTRAAPGSRRA